jgi:membrane protein
VSPRRGPLTWLRRVRDRVPGLRVLVQAVQNYIRHQSANQAGSVAFSSALAMFPLLLFVSAAAGFVGQPGAAAELASRVMEYVPPMIADALRPVIDDVLAQRSRALLAIGIVATIWTASSGAQAIRTALNKAYGVTQGLSFWKARIKVTLFTVIGTFGTVMVFSSVVILPYVLTLLEKTVGLGADALWLRTGVRYGLAFVVLVMLYAILYGWLPDIPQRLRTVLPGALIGALMWLAAAAILSYTLRSAGKLALVYGGFAGLVATLVFLYVSAVTLIFGAEINAVLRERRREETEPALRHARGLEGAQTSSGTPSGPASGTSGPLRAHRGRPA